MIAWLAESPFWVDALRVTFPLPFRMDRLLPDLPTQYAESPNPGTFFLVKIPLLGHNRTNLVYLKEKRR